MTEPDIQKIKKQVEFYFSDSNYRVDTFLKSECASSGGWLPISTLLKFKRLSKLNATVASVKEALKDSEVVETNTNDQIRKIITERYREYIANEDVDDRIIGIRGLDRGMELEGIEELLCKYMKPELIRMRRDKKKRFNGSVLVELSTPDDAKKALELKIPVEWNERDVANSSGGASGADDTSDGRLETDEVKKVKKTPKYLTISTKKDFLELSREDAGKENILCEFYGKVFRFKADAELSIHEIKKAVAGCAFVDIKGSVLRFKKAQSFDEKVFGEGDKLIRLTRMADKETEKYVSAIDAKAPKKKRKK